MFSLRSWVRVDFSVGKNALLQLFEVIEFIKYDGFVAFVSWDNNDGVVGFESFNESPISREKITTGRFVCQFFVDPF